MNKRLAVLFALLTVSVASAATLKMKEFCSTDGIGDKDGIATLHYVPGQGATKLHVTITGFESDRVYHVVIGASAVVPRIETNNGGNGEVSIDIPGDVTGSSCTITIFEDTNGNSEFDDGIDSFAAEGTAR